MTVDDFLKLAVQTLRRCSLEQPSMEAEWLISGLLGWRRVEVITRDHELIPRESLQRLKWGLERRSQGEPLAYILGYKDFYKFRFVVGPGVLIPRPETEFVVEAALEYLECEGRSLKFLQIADFGSGSGCIGLSILMEKPEAYLWAIEKSPQARTYLTKNIELLGCESRVSILATAVEDIKNFQEQEQEQEQEEQEEQKLDMIVANPPYIDPQDSTVMKSVVEFEPYEALFSEKKGYQSILSWLDAGARFLKPEGLFILEVGAGQDSQLLNFLEEKWQLVEIKKDLSGWGRVLILRLNKKIK